MSFIQSNTLAFEEVNTRRDGRKGLLKFGIDFLDDALAGILKNDLILLGAPSGAGKTAICCNIARANIELGKRVHYIALEAEYGEIERRIKYQLFSKYFYQDPQRPKDIRISFQNWMLGDYFDTCTLYEAQAASDFAEKYSNQYTFYKQGKFDVNDFVQKVLECSDETDLIIVDHVHYFDLDDDENKSIKHIAKTARDLALEQGKPIILVSHLRKSNKQNEPLAPGIEEFHGSSDLYKISTKAITIGPGKYTSDGRIETFFRVVKNRFEGSVTRQLASCVYSSTEGRYEKGYKLADANCTRDRGFEELAPHLYPAWAINHGRASGGSSRTTQAK